MALIFSFNSQQESKHASQNLTIVFSELQLFVSENNYEELFGNLVVVLVHFCPFHPQPLWADLNQEALNHSCRAHSWHQHRTIARRPGSAPCGTRLPPAPAPAQASQMSKDILMEKGKSFIERHSWTSERSPASALQMWMVICDGAKKISGRAKERLDWDTLTF